MHIGLCARLGRSVPCDDIVISRRLVPDMKLRADLVPSARLTCTHQNSMATRRGFVLLFVYIFIIFCFSISYFLLPEVDITMGDPLLGFRAW